MNQEHAQVGIASVGDPEMALLPGRSTRQTAYRWEGSPIGNRCHHGSCDHRTNAFYSSDLLAECVAAVDLLNPLFHGRDALLQCAQFLVESAQKLSAESTQQRVVFLDQPGGVICAPG